MRLKHRPLEFARPRQASRPVSGRNNSAFTMITFIYIKVKSFTTRPVDREKPLGNTCCPVVPIPRCYATKQSILLLCAVSPITERRLSLQLRRRPVIGQYRITGVGATTLTTCAGSAFATTMRALVLPAKATPVDATKTAAMHSGIIYTRIVNLIMRGCTLGSSVSRITRATNAGSAEKN